MPTTAMLRHAVAVSKAAAQHGATAAIDLPDCALRLGMAGVQHRWAARFVARTAGGLAYSEAPGDSTFGFGGWLPYPVRQWPQGTGKAAFRRHAQASGLAMPAACIDPKRIGGPFLVKSESGSFGRGQRGPFLAFDPSDPAQRLQPGEYYENFIAGWIAKGWCWGPDCVVLELERPPTVTGDGRSTLRALAQAAGAYATDDLVLLARVAAYCGIADLDTVVPEGRQVLVHYRYGANPRTAAASIAGQQMAAPAGSVQAQYAQAAAACAGCITAAGWPVHTLYTLDAVVDGDGTALFLEMNCNPLVHPDAYGAMVAWFAAEGAGARLTKIAAAPQKLQPA